MTAHFRTSRNAITTAVGLALGFGLPCGSAQAAPDVYALQHLGKKVFFAEISRPKNKQACASCHDPAAGWTNPKQKINKTTVAVPGASFHPKKDPSKIGNLKPPANAYAVLSPPFTDSALDRFFCTGFGPPSPNNPLCYVGGNFWNGRAEGTGLLDADPSQPGATDTVRPAAVFHLPGSGGLSFDLQDAYRDFLGPTTDQALNPFPNSVEQNVQEQQVCKHVKNNAAMASLYQQAWGEPIKCNDNEHNPVTRLPNYHVAYQRIAVALGAYQSSYEVVPFNSKRDKKLALDGTFPLDGFTKEENYGHDLFYNTAFAPPVTLTANSYGVKNCGKNVGAPLPATNCTVCHNSRPVNPVTGAGDISGTDPDQGYSDHSYHNIGVPVNLDIPNADFVDDGLFEHTNNAAHLGHHKTPTLRNVDKRPTTKFTKAYTHNGWFKSLESLIHWYNTAAIGGATANAFGITRCANDVSEQVALLQRCWPEPEFQDGVSIGFLTGDMGMNACEEKALISYLKTLTDTGPVVKPNQPPAQP